MALKDAAHSKSESDRLAACVRAVDRFLSQQLEALPRDARKSLISRSQEALDRDEEDRLIAMVEEAEALAPIASTAFRAAVLARMKVPDEVQGDTVAPEDGSGLTLVDSGKVDDWLRMREIVERHSAATRAREAVLRPRLARLAGGSSNPDSVPVSVSVMCALFQAAMRKLSAGPEVRAAIYDAFEATVVARLGTLMAELYRILELPEGADTGFDADNGGADAAPGNEASAIRPPPGPEPDDDEAALEDPPEPEEASMEPARLLGAMASVERQMRDVATGRGLQALAELEAQIVTALTPPGTRLDEQEHQGMKAVASLLHQAFAHPGIDPAVRARLWKLAPALGLLVLQGDAQLDLLLQATRHDPVTGLLDRAAFRARVDAALVNAAAHGQEFAVCLVEVDGFQDIGQRQGPQVAGRLLRVLADLMRRSAGPSVHLARLRGADFGALLPAVKADSGWRFAHRYLSAVNKAHFAVGGHAVPLTVSIGVVESDRSLTDAGQVMRAADTARASAREDGGGCARVHIPDSFA